MNKYVVGVDVGGTNIKLGLVSPSRNVIDRTNFSTSRFIRDRKKLINAIAAQIIEIIEKHNLSLKDLQGIGIGLPGLIDTPGGIVRFLPNIPGWRNVPLKKILEQALKVPVFLGNDASLITLGEWKHGAGRGVHNMVCMTLGTGVGAGLILNNRLYRGPGFAAGELGHVPLNEHGPKCGCGSHGCFESYVGNKRLMAQASEIMKRPMTLEQMRELAEGGNAKALKFWKTAAVHMGNGLVGIINLLNPERVVIGGGVSNNHEFLFPTIRKIVSEKAMPTQASMVKIVRATLGNDAGILGAQVLVNEEQRI
jgi:glucokinase